MRTAKESLEMSITGKCTFQEKIDKLYEKHKGVIMGKIFNEIDEAISKGETECPHPNLSQILIESELTIDYKFREGIQKRVSEELKSLGYTVRCSMLNNLYLQWGKKK
jgi:hypothetical protein